MFASKLTEAKLFVRNNRVMITGLNKVYLYVEITNSANNRHRELNRTNYAIL